MSERRSLIEGLKPSSPPVDPSREREFVYGTGSKPKAEVATQPPAPTTNVARSPISTRIRADFAAGLKRASLERQLQGVEPSTLQDILEAAIEPWLKANGYLS